MIPKTENDYNNFKDTIYDKYNRSGYLIQRGRYYIFQPFDDNEDISLYYRQNYEFATENMIPVKNYFTQKYGEVKEKVSKDTRVVKTKQKGYDFKSVQDYYDNRNENFIVGIIDKNINKLATEDNDLFKIRPPLNKSVDKKRGTGIYSLKGAVCSTSKDKEYLLNVLKKTLNSISKIRKNQRLSLNKKSTRADMCNMIKSMLLYLEKYSTSKDKNKLTYIMIPANHPIFPFPYNLEDRIKYKLNKIKDITKREFSSVVKKMKNGKFLNEREDIHTKYEIKVKHNKYMKDHEKDIKKLGGVLDKNMWTIIIE